MDANSRSRILDRWQGQGSRWRLHRDHKIKSGPAHQPMPSRPAGMSQISARKNGLGETKMRTGRGSVQKRDRERAKLEWRLEKERRKSERHSVVPRMVRFGEESVDWGEEFNATK